MHYVNKCRTRAKRFTWNPIYDEVKHMKILFSLQLNVFYELKENTIGVFQEDLMLWKGLQGWERYKS